MTRTRSRRRETNARDRRPILLGVVALAVVGVALVAFAFTRPSDASFVSWSRLGTDDVHSLAFVDGDPDRLLFGHHGGILGTIDGGRTWSPAGTRSDAMALGAVGRDSIVIAGHDVFAESRDAGLTWSNIPADLPSLDIHGFTRDPGDPARMWAALATGGLWESRDSGRSWTRVQEQNVLLPVAYAAAAGTRLIGVTAEGISRSDDTGRTWLAVTDPQLYPVTSLAASADGAVLVAAGPDGLARSDDRGATWLRIPVEDPPATVAISADGRSIAFVARTTRFYRSDDGGTSWPGPR